MNLCRRRTDDRISLSLLAWSTANYDIFCEWTDREEIKQTRWVFSLVIASFQNIFIGVCIERCENCSLMADWYWWNSIANDHLLILRHQIRCNSSVCRKKEYRCLLNSMCSWWQAIRASVFQTHCEKWFNIKMFAIIHIQSVLWIILSSALHRNILILDHSKLWKTTSILYKFLTFCFYAPKSQIWS